MNRLLSNLIKTLLALLIWPAICIGVLIVDMVFIWKTDTLHKPKVDKGQGGKTIMPMPTPDKHMDVAGSSPDKVATNTTAAIDWDEVAIYYPYIDGHS